MRRLLFAAVVLGLAACASKPPPVAAPSTTTTSAGVWTYAFDAGPGIAMAVLTGVDNQTLVRVVCQAPRGNLIITDWTFSRGRGGDMTGTFSVGAQSKQTPVRIAGDGAGRQTLSMVLPSRDPMWEALTPTAEVKTVAGGYTHIWAGEAASRLNDVLNSCRAQGS